VVFVHSCSGADRLWSCRKDGRPWVANSLPALLAAAGVSLCDDYAGYTPDVETIEREGLKGYRRTIPAEGVELRVAYFYNLVFERGELSEADKPNVAPEMRTFEDYWRFLVDTAGKMGRNMRSGDRRLPVEPLATVSSGYDSCAAAVIARQAGCERAATIRQSTSIWRGSDSGAAVAESIGLDCREYDRRPARYPHEVAIWAGAGLGGGLNFTTFEYPQPLSMLFTGLYGDTVWGLKPRDLSNPLGDRDALLGEFRVIQGMFHCTVCWWGIGRAAEIQAIGLRPEMAPWTLNTGYDRPIPRRIVEQAGAARETFGMIKRNTSTNTSFPWPRSPDARASLRRYLAARGAWAPPGPMLWAIHRLAGLEKAIHQNLLRPIGLRRRLRPWQSLACSRLLFQWANDDLKQRYRRGLIAAGVNGPEDA
jgi:hypothetical protein